MNIMNSTAGDTEPLIAGQKYLVKSTTDTFIGVFVGVIINHDLNNLGGVYLEFGVNGKAASVWSKALKSIKLTDLEPLKIYEAVSSWEDSFVSRVKCDQLALLKETSRLKKHLCYSSWISGILAAAFTWAAITIYLICS